MDNTFDFQNDQSKPFLVLTGNATIFFKYLSKYSEDFSSYLVDNWISDQASVQSRILFIINHNYAPFLLELYLRIILIIIKTDCLCLSASDLLHFISLIRMMDKYISQTHILFRIIKIYCKHINKSPVFIDEDIPDYIYMHLEGSALISILKCIAYQYYIFDEYNDQELLHRTVISLHILDNLPDGLTYYQKFQFYHLLFKISENQLLRVHFILSPFFCKYFTAIITEKTEYMFRNIHICLELIEKSCNHMFLEKTIIALIFAMKNVPANENNVEIKEISKKICLVIGDNDEIYVNIFQNYTIMEYSSKKVLQDMIMHMFENLKRVPSTDLGVFFDPLYDLIIFTQTELIEEEDMELPDELKEIILYFSQNGFEDQLECFL